MDSKRLRTVQVVPLTAFDTKDRVDLAPMEELTRRLTAAGISVFLPAAGTGEFHSLSANEVVSIVQMTKRVVGDDGVVIAPVGFQIGYALDVGRRALDVGADALLIMPPVAPYLCDAGLRDYYLKIIDTLGAPTLFYKKGDHPSDRLVLELAAHSGVAGVKYAGKDVDAFGRLVADGSSLTEWLCGIAEPFAPTFMLAGATGYTSGAGNLAPRLTLAMHTALERGAYQEALRLQQQIRPIEDFRARAGSSYNISCLKYAIRFAGLDFGLPRLPQRLLTDDEVKELGGIVEALLQAEEKLI